MGLTFSEAPTTAGTSFLKGVLLADLHIAASDPRVSDLTTKAALWRTILTIDSGRGGRGQLNLDATGPQDVESLEAVAAVIDAIQDVALGGPDAVKTLGDTGDIVAALDTASVESTAGYWGTPLSALLEDADDFLVSHPSVEDQVSGPSAGDPYYDGRESNVPLVAAGGTHQRCLDIWKEATFGWPHDEPLYDADANQVGIKLRDMVLVDANGIPVAKVSGGVFAVDTFGNITADKLPSVVYVPHPQGEHLLVPAEVEDHGTLAVRIDGQARQPDKTFFDEIRRTEQEHKPKSTEGMTMQQRNGR